MMLQSRSVGRQSPAWGRGTTAAPVVRRTPWAAAAGRGAPHAAAPVFGRMSPGQRRNQHHIRTSPNTPCQAATSLAQQSSSQMLPLVQAVTALPSIVKGMEKGTQLLTLLCAAAVLATACMVMPRAPGFVVCLLLLSAVAVMETFWKKFVVFQRKRLPTLTVAGDVGDAASAQALRLATAPGLQLLAAPPAEAAAWLASAQQDMWGALWQPLLDYREAWQEALMVDGPYAWAYDASGITIGSLVPTLSGVQAYCHPHTGALVAVEADVLLDTSTAPDSVALQVQARGPIGKYSFSLEAARVQGRVRLVPVPQHGQLAMQYVTTPSVDVAFSTAYPARLPHDRSKLQQLDVIEEMLQGTLAGVLGSPDAVRLTHTVQFPASLQYGLGAAARAATSWAARSKSHLTAALHQRNPFAKASPDAQQPAAADGIASSEQQLGAPGKASASSSCSSSASNGAAASVEDGSSKIPVAPKNSTVSESAALSLVAQQAAWRQKQQQPDVHLVAAQETTAAPSPTRHRRTVSPSKLFAALSTAISSSSGSSSAEAAQADVQQKPGWQLSGAVSEAVECWTSAGPTAKMSAVAAAAATAPAAGATGSSANNAAVAVAAAALGAPCITAPHLHINLEGSSSARSGANKPRSQPKAATAQRGPYTFIADSCSSYAVPVTVLGSSRGSSSTGGGDGNGHSSLADQEAAPDASGTAPAAAAPAERELAVASAGATRKGGSGSTARSSSVGVAARQQAASSAPSNKRSAVIAAGTPLRFSAGAATSDSAPTVGAAAAAAAGALVLPPPASRRWLLPWVATASVVLLGGSVFLRRR